MRKDGKDNYTIALRWVQSVFELRILLHAHIDIEYVVFQFLQHALTQWYLLKQDLENQPVVCFTGLQLLLAEKFNGSQLAKLEKSIPDMSLLWNL